MADLVVLPYLNLKYTENVPSCLLEAMACKTPIVTTDHLELREIVIPEKDVLMAQPENPISLTKNIIRLLNDKQLQNKLTESSYKKSKKYDVRKITKQFIKLYEAVHNGG